LQGDGPTEGRPCRQRVPFLLVRLARRIGGVVHASGSSRRPPWAVARMRMKPAVGAALLLVAFSVDASRAAQAPTDDPGEVLNALLGGLLGFKDLTGPELQKEVAEAGGIPFKAD